MKKTITAGLVITVIALWSGWASAEKKSTGACHIEYADGRYDGECLNGKPHGQGKFYSTDGSRYEGEFRDSKVSSQGKLYLTDGGRYEGEFRDYKFNGQGKFYYANGSRYEGEWRDNEKNGRGTETGTDGERYDGYFENDKLQGRAIVTLSNGRRVNVICRNGVCEDDEEDNGYSRDNSASSSYGYTAPPVYVPQQPVYVPTPGYSYDPNPAYGSGGLTEALGAGSGIGQQSGNPYGH